MRKARLQRASWHGVDILRDIESLLPHNESLLQKVNFLMQAAMGFIEIEQNRIIKVVSVVSVVSWPPTLVASGYGMNLNYAELTLELWLSGSHCVDDAGGRRRISTSSVKTGCKKGTWLSSYWLMQAWPLRNRHWVYSASTITPPARPR